MLTMDSATEFLFGESTNCLTPESNRDNTEFAEAFNRSQEAIAETFRTGKIGEWLRGSMNKDDRKYCQDFVDKFVRKGLEYRKTFDVEKIDAKAADRYVFLYELVKKTTDPVQLRSELMNVLLAGRDTTASLLSDTWFVLARRPDIWAKLREEVDALGGEKPTFQQIKDMKYLKWVLNECKHLIAILISNLTHLYGSTPPLPSSSRKHPLRRGRHHSPGRRRRGRQISPLHPQRPSSAMVAVLDAPPKRPIWRRRRRVQPREMGEAEAWLGKPL